MGQSLVNAPLRLLQRDTIPVDFGFKVSGGDAYETGLGTLGVIGVASYSNSWDTRKAVQQEGQFSAGVLIPASDKIVDSTRNDVQLNFLGGLSIIGENNELKWTNFYVRNTTKEARSRAGSDFDAGGDIIRDDHTEWFVRELFTTQLSGSHDFMGGDLTVDWRTSYATTSRDAPYESRFVYGVDGAGNFIHNVQGNLISFSKLNDEVLSGGADVSYTVPLSDYREAVFSAGFALLDNTRDAERRDLQFAAVGSLTADQRESRVDYLFSDFNINPTTLELREVTGSNGASAYDAALKVNAVYAMVDAEIIPLVRTTVGLRFEDGKQSVTPSSRRPGSRSSIICPPSPRPGISPRTSRFAWGLPRRSVVPSSGNWLPSPIPTPRATGPSSATPIWSIPRS